MSGVYQRLLAKLAFVVPGGDSLRPALHRMRGVQVGRSVWISQYVYLDELYPEAISCAPPSLPTFTGVRDAFSRVSGR